MENSAWGRCFSLVANLFLLGFISKDEDLIKYGFEEVRKGQRTLRECLSFVRRRLVLMVAALYFTFCLLIHHYFMAISMCLGCLVSRRQGEQSFGCRLRRLLFLLSSTWLRSFWSSAFLPLLDSHQLSSAHVYLRLRPDQNWENIPAPLLADCAQLVKANSIEGNKKNNITIIYTPWSNIKKQGDMAIGSVTFHNDRKVGWKDFSHGE